MLTTNMYPFTNKMAVTGTRVRVPDLLPNHHRGFPVLPGARIVPPNTSYVLFKQINLAKSKLASADFAKRLTDWSSNCLVALIQEPAITLRGLLEFIPVGAQSFASLRPRTAIVATKDVSLWPLPAEYTSPDLAVCLWKTGDEHFPEIVLVSVYADTNNPSIPVELEKVTSYCGIKKLSLHHWRRHECI